MTLIIGEDEEVVLYPDVIRQLFDLQKNRGYFSFRLLGGGIGKPSGLQVFSALEMHFPLSAKNSVIEVLSLIEVKERE